MEWQFAMLLLSINFHYCPLLRIAEQFVNEGKRKKGLERKGEARRSEGIKRGEMIRNLLG